MSTRGSAETGTSPCCATASSSCSSPALQRPGAVFRRRHPGPGRAHRGRCWRPARPRAAVGIDRDTEALALAGERLAAVRRPRHRGARGVRRAARGPRPTWACRTVARRALRPRRLLAAARRGRARVSPTATTRRWTCGWTRAPASPRPRSSTPTTPPSSTRILREYGEERFARRDRRRDRPGAPAASRSPPPPASSSCSSAPSRPPRRSTGGHPAKRTFQALRIEVNAELAGLGERPARRGGRPRRRRPDRRPELPLPGGPADQAAVRPRVPAAPPRPACRSSCPSTRRTCGCSRAGPRSPARTRRT